MTTQRVPYDPAGSQPVALWEADASDGMRVLILQTCGDAVNIIDSYKNAGKPIAHYAAWVRGLKYAERVGVHVLPRDFETCLQTLREAGLRNLKITGDDTGK